MSLKSKNEVQVNKDVIEGKAKEEVKESEMITKDSVDASDVWGKQREPSLSDTADGLNRTAESLRSDIREQHGEQAEKVDESIETQLWEVSEPAREGAKEAGAAAAEFGVEASKNKRLGKIIEEASELLQDEESFLNDIADDDEGIQGEIDITLNDHRQAVENAVQGIRNL